MRGGALDLVHFIAQPSPCSYLPAETASLEYCVPLDLDSRRFSQLLQRGWRRFGNVLFRPKCPDCCQCRSIRIPVDRFAPSKSQRRVLRRNGHIEVRVVKPRVSDEHVALYNAYHHDMSCRRGWRSDVTTAEEYHESFIGAGYEFGREFQYRDQGRLVGVGLVDVVADGLSSAYFFHDPAWRPLAPGTFSILTEIAQARRDGIPYVYLGYWIQQNPSMNYKAHFQPHELLEHYVDEDERPVWRAVATGEATR